MSDEKDLLDDLEPKETPQQKEEVTTPEQTPEEKEASSKGWKPKDKWVEEGGAEEDWKPAKVFNEIGQLKEKLVERERESKKLNKVVQLMKEHHLNVRKAAYEDALKTMKDQRAEALKNEDFATAEKIRDEIDDIKDKFRDDKILPAHVEKVIKEESKEPDPAFFTFVERNPWYKPGGKDEMSKKADALGWAYHQENPDMTFKEVIEQVEKDIKKLYPDKFERPKGGPNDNGSRASGTGSKAKVSLSAEELEIAKGFGMTPEEYAKELGSYKGR